MAAFLTRRQVIEEVNKTPNLRKRFVDGSWDYFAPRAGVSAHHQEPVPGLSHLWRDVYEPDAVKKIADIIGYLGPVGQKG